MAKPELLNYIELKQSKGVSREDITRALLVHGWPLGEINDGFYILENPVYDPSHGMQLPPQPAYIHDQSSIFSEQFQNPTFLMGLAVFFVGCLLGGGSLFLSGGTTLPLPYAAIALVLMFLTWFATAAIFFGITRILRIHGSTFGKALFYTGMTLGITFLLGLLLKVGLPLVLFAVVGTIANLVLFWYYYSVTFLKTLAVAALALVFGIIFFIIITVVMGFVGFGLFKMLFPSDFGVGQPMMSNQPIQLNMPVSQ